MKPITSIAYLWRGIFAVSLIFFACLISARAQTSTFTYQGRLSDASSSATGTYDFQFALYDTGGTLIGLNSTATTGVQVTNGVFTVQLDFGAAAFPGADRTLEIAVRRGAETGVYTKLTPRQPITSTPYAIKSLNATNADTATTATTATTAKTAMTATDAQQLGGTAASQFTQNDSQTFIRNQTTQQRSANFNIDGTGTASIFNATTQYNIGGNRVLSNPGTNNLFAGVGAGSVNTGNRNSFVGTAAGQNNTTGSANSFFGEDAGFSNKTGGDNSFFGRFAGRTNTASLNSFFGSAAGFSNTTGNSNSFVGESAGQFNTTGNRNSFVGESAGFSNATGANNTIIGQGANVGSGALTFATAIGSHAVVNTDDTVVIGKVAGTYNSVARPADTVETPGNLRTNGLTRAGSETGTSQSPGISGDIFAGLVTRRINSTDNTDGSVVARTDNITLIRDGTIAGLGISYTASTFGGRTLHCMGVDSTGASVNARRLLGTNAGWSLVYSDAQDVEFAQCSFGNTSNQIHLTQVTLQRRQGSSYWVGTVTSTFNQ